MKKIILLVLSLILVVSLAGCGGGSKKKATNPSSTPNPQDEIGAAMEQDTIWDKFTEINGITINLQQIVKKCYPAPNFVDSVAYSQTGSSGPIFKLEWTGPDNQGWYTQQTEYPTFKIRYLKSTNTVELVESYQNDSMSIENIKVFQQNSQNLWSGYWKIITSTKTGKEKQIIETKCNDFDVANATGSFEEWLEFQSTNQNVPRFQKLKATITTSGDKLIVNGWYKDNPDDQEIPITDYQVERPNF